MAKALIGTAIVLTLGKYFWQFIFGGNYAVAFERSPFQAIALLCVGLNSR